MREQRRDLTDEPFKGCTAEQRPFETSDRLNQEQGIEAEWLGGQSSARRDQVRSELARDRSRSAGWQRSRVHLDRAAIDPNAISRELLGEGGRRAAVLQPVLKTVPRTGHEAIDDATFGPGGRTNW